MFINVTFLKYSVDIECFILQSFITLYAYAYAYAYPTPHLFIMFILMLILILLTD